MGWLAKLRATRWQAHQSSAPAPVVSGEEEADEYLLARLRESYVEVLAATKHEDDKVGRFLAAIAFLVAGALIFAQQAEALRATYDLGVELALPALSLVAFLFAITLAVLQYVLAIAAPVTIPPGMRDRADHSHMFFLLIAQETKASWQAQWDLSKVELRQKLIAEYQDEIANLGQRAHQKRQRSEEASALFAVALLFFGLAVAFAIDTRVNPGIPEWSLSVRLGVAVWLVTFAALLLYQRYRGRVVREIGFTPDADERPRGFGRVVLGLTATIFLLLSPNQELDDALRVSLAAAAFLAVVVVAWGMRSVIKWSEQSRAPRALWMALAVILLLGAPAALWLDVPAIQLLVALIAALSPLVGQVMVAVGETGRLRTGRRRREAELSQAMGRVQSG